jgi:hypothetical protein
MRSDRISSPNRRRQLTLPPSHLWHQSTYYRSIFGHPSRIRSPKLIQTHSRICPILIYAFRYPKLRRIISVLSLIISYGRALYLYWKEGALAKSKGYINAKLITIMNQSDLMINTFRGVGHEDELFEQSRHSST